MAGGTPALPLKKSAVVCCGERAVYQNPLFDKARTLPLTKPIFSARNALTAFRHCANLDVERVGDLLGSLG